MDVVADDETDAPITISAFDYSVDNFFNVISDICAASGERHTFDDSEISRVSPTITFLKEWKHFQYEPKTVNFAYQSETARAVKGINLSQFASAAVPQMEKLPDGPMPDGNDFVLHAGGPVWALDWCPRIRESSDNNINCEYLAVAAHPPGSAYHKIGMPLIGRGVIQIWCLLNISEKVEYMPAGTKHRGLKKKTSSKELLNGLCCENPVSTAARPRGRPRKITVAEKPLSARPRGRPRKITVAEEPLYESDFEDRSYIPPATLARPKKRPKVAIEDINDRQEISLAKPVKRPILGSEGSARPRGRPRKHPLPGLINLSGKQDLAAPCTSSITSLNERISPLTGDFEEVALALPASVDLNGKEESLIPMHRGSRRKEPISNVNECISDSGIELGRDASVLPTPRGGHHDFSADLEEVPLDLLGCADLNIKKDPVVRKRRGRPRKKPIINVNDCSPGSVAEIDKDVALTLPASVDLNGKEESLILTHRGSPKKEPMSNVNEHVSASGIELGKDASVSPTPGGGHHDLTADLEEVPLDLLASSDLNIKKDPVVLKRRGRPRKKPILNVFDSAPASGAEIKGDASAQIPSSRGFENLRLAASGNNLGEVPLVLPAPADLSGTGEPLTTKRRGRPRKIPIQYLEEVPPPVLAPADLNVKEEPFVPKRRGRPKKKQIPNVENCAPASVFELGQVASAALPATGRLESLSSSAVSSNFGEVSFRIHASANLSGEVEPPVLKSRGSTPEKRPIHNSDECVTTPSVELRENVLALPNSKGLESSSMKFINSDLEEATPVRPAAPDLNGERNTGKERKNSILNVKESVTATGLGFGEDASAVPSDGKQSAVTVEPTYDNDNQDRIVLCDEVMHSRLTNADTSRSIIPKGISLPRVVLCLAHNGKVAWDVKWRPSNVNTSEGKSHLGYLAVLLGNGSLEVWEVPPPSMVKKLYASCCREEGTDPRFLKLEPVFRCSKLKCGDRQSIPLTVEWSTSGLRDLILAGCHDGTVALWKFSTHCSSEDTKPLLRFSADSVPIRALAWAPEGSYVESENLIVTAGHEGLKLWDIRDPYRPLWDFNPVQRFILSLDWLKDPRCIILSFDDGTLRTISLWKVGCDVPVTGKLTAGPKQSGIHVFPCSSFAIWSVQVSRATGLVAYCSSDGSAIRFQLTAKAVDKDASRYRQPHFLCGSLIEEGQTLNINTPLPNTPLSDVPFSLKKSLSDLSEAPRTIVSYLSDAKQAQQAISQLPALGLEDDQSVVPQSGDFQTPPLSTPKHIGSKKKKLKSDASPISGRTIQSSEKQNAVRETKIEVFPPKIVAMHRVRWNMNKGSERWLCYGGAAGIIRCQAIGSPTIS